MDKSQGLDLRRRWEAWSWRKKPLLVILLILILLLLSSLSGFSLSSFIRECSLWEWLSMCLVINKTDDLTLLILQILGRLAQLVTTQEEESETKATTPIPPKRYKPSSASFPSPQLLQPPTRWDFILPSLFPGRLCIKAFFFFFF